VYLTPKTNNEKKTIMKGQVLDILVGAATIAVGYTLAAVIYKNLNSGSATRSSSEAMAPADMMASNGTMVSNGTPA
jgi:hypothetical protein